MTTSLIEQLNSVAVTLWGDPVNWTELLGFLTGGACVALTVRPSVANFPVGIANSAFFLVLFASARLWADSALQIIHVALGFIGWYFRIAADTIYVPRYSSRGLNLTAVVYVLFLLLGIAGLRAWSRDYGQSESSRPLGDSA